MKIILTLLTLLYSLFSCAQSIEGYWEYLANGTIFNIAESNGLITATMDHGDVIGRYEHKTGDLYASTKRTGVFMELISQDTLVLFNVKTSKMNVFKRKLENQAPIVEEIVEATEEIGLASPTAVVSEATATVTSSQTSSQPTVIPPVSTVNFKVGDSVFWTEKETYKTGSSGSVLGDMFLGDLYKSTYVIEYVGIIEALIGDKLKVIIQDVGMDDPKWASYNYASSKSEVYSQATRNIGQTRVRDRTSVKLY